MSRPGQPFFGINASNEGRVVIFAGGVPLKHDGRVVGAVGSSGGQPDQDHEVAEAGAAAFRPGRKSDGYKRRAHPQSLRAREPSTLELHPRST